jgi:hypothetical protein
MGFPFAIRRCPQGWAIDAYGNTMVFKAIQEGVDEALSLEEVIPFRIV